MEQELTIQAALVPDGPNGLGRPTHVFVDGAGVVFVAWRGHAAGDPAPAGRWTVRQVGRWHDAARDGQHFEAWEHTNPYQWTNVYSDAFPTVLDLGYIALRIERELQRVAMQHAGVTNTVSSNVGGTVVQAVSVDGDLNMPLTPQGDKLSEEQEATLERMWPLISRLAEDVSRSLRGQTVIAVPRTWPQVSRWEGYPMRRMPVTKPALLVFGPDVDAPVEDL